MQKRLMIIDGNSLLYRGFYAMPLLTTAEGKFTNAVYSFVTILVRAIEQITPDYLVVAFDYGKKTFRNEMFDGYKAGRSETPIELQGQFPIIKEVLSAMNICYLEKQGIEADDIIATICKRFDMDKIIITGDKDSFQLIDDKTTVYLNRKGISDIKIVDTRSLFAEYGITPSQVVDVKALMGDKSDNIPGVRGIGEIIAYKLIKEYGSIDNVYANIDNVTGTAIRNKLIAGKDDAYLSYKLGQSFVDETLECELENCKLKFPFSEEVKGIFRKYEFKSLLKKKIFVEEKKEYVEVQGEKISEEAELDKLIEKLNSVKIFSYYYNNEQVQILCDDVYYTIEIDYSFLNTGLKFKNILMKMKTVFENDKILKIVFGFKSLLYEVANLNIDFKNVFDCSIAKYLLESTIKDYNIEDLCRDFETNVKVVALYRAYQDYLPRMEKLNLVKLFNEIEMPLCKVLYNMEVAGVRIDTVNLKKYDEKFTSEIADCEREVFALVGHEFNLKSPKQVGDILYDELNLANSKKKSTSVENLTSLQDKHPVVPLIIRHRRLIKLKNTYIDNYFKFEKNGFIHCEFNQVTTDTGRLSSTNPNLQNIPVRDDEGKFIREVFVSRFDGGLITSFDYDQIELKLMAHMSNDAIMIDAFNSGKDIHRATASKIYNINEEDVTKEQRQSAKAVNFGIIYGQGAYGLSMQLGCSVKQASEFIESYFATFSSVKNYITENLKKIIENDCTAITLFGRRRHIPELLVENYNLRQFGERVATNMPLQGTASDIIKIAMIRINEMMEREKFESKLILQIHDELVFDTKPEELEKLKVNVKAIMEDVIKLKVPLTVSISSGENLLKS
ncbi:MAG: DNA polymerase I [Clostridia bacterium]|nr:DNA polymerase I [Clostridia bacterium]